MAIFEKNIDVCLIISSLDGGNWNLLVFFDVRNENKYTRR